jgi:hypothetical protein
MEIVSNCDETMSSDIESELHEVSVGIEDWSTINGSQNKIWSNSLHSWNSGDVAHQVIYDLSD